MGSHPSAASSSALAQAAFVSLSHSGGQTPLRLSFAEGCHVAIIGSHTHLSSQQFYAMGLPSCLRLVQDCAAERPRAERRSRPTVNMISRPGCIRSRELLGRLRNGRRFMEMGHPHLSHM